ncbi:hypothetical protein GQ473_01680 [archaeon]|nr:hypothetical protein [archaeon]
MLIFISRFLLLALPFYFILWLNFDAYPLQLLTANAVSFILTILNVEYELNGHLIFIPSVLWTIEIIKDCVGWKSLMALWGLIFATRGICYKTKVYGALAGIPLIFIGNAIRIASSIWLAIMFGLDKFTFIHDFLWQWGLIALVLGIWWVWLGKTTVRN